MLSNVLGLAAQHFSFFGHANGGLFVVHLNVGAVSLYFVSAGGFGLEHLGEVKEWKSHCVELGCLCFSDFIQRRGCDCIVFPDCESKR
jgi:hypothetical protein